MRWKTQQHQQLFNAKFSNGFVSFLVVLSIIFWWKSCLHILYELVPFDFIVIRFGLLLCAYTNIFICIENIEKHVVLKGATKDRQ